MHRLYSVELTVVQLKSLDFWVISRLISVVILVQWRRFNSSDSDFKDRITNVYQLLYNRNSTEQLKKSRLLFNVFSPDYRII